MTLLEKLENKKRKVLDDIEVINAELNGLSAKLDLIEELIHDEMNDQAIENINNVY